MVDTIGETVLMARNMPKVPPFHTTWFGYPKAATLVYHDRSDCPDAKRIKKQHRLDGDGGLHRCKECQRLETAAQTKKRS